MRDIYPYFTCDGTVGLFSPETDDIYHSTYGALNEAYEKFILPANFQNYFKNNNQIKILDICFGIGYNTKSFLKYFIENISNETIYTDNINTYNDKIHTDNVMYNIFIHAIDNDKILTNLSPFFKIETKNIQNQKFIFNNKRIEKILSENNPKNKYTKNEMKILQQINKILLKNIKNSINSDVTSIISDKKYSQFFDRSIIRYFAFINNQTIQINLLMRLNSFLHNIYYKYISTSYKNAPKALKNADFNFKLSNDDARFVIKNDNNKYNFIFLDSFTPDKCPCLWTSDFFKLLYEHLDDYGMILTYTTSARVRNAMLNAGFKIFKTYLKSQNKFCGTAAVKNKVKNDNLFDLDKSEYELLKTKAGIFYKDEFLNLSNEDILKKHKFEFDNSNLMSTTKFKKLQNIIGI